MAIVLAANGILTAAQFRQLIPAFADSSKYTDEMLSVYLPLAASMLVPAKWNDWLPLGMALMVAHYISLDAREAAIAARGGVPGQAGIGILSSKSIGGVSAGYDVSSGNELNAGHWNLTTYGKRYIHMARLVGMGGTQITGAVGSSAPSPNDFNGPIF